MKSPPQQFPDHLARELTLEFIRLHGAVDEPLPLRRVPADRGQVEHDYSIRARSARDVRAD